MSAPSQKSRHDRWKGIFLNFCSLHLFSLKIEVLLVFSNIAYCHQQNIAMLITEITNI